MRRAQRTIKTWKRPSHVSQRRRWKGCSRRTVLYNHQGRSSHARANQASVANDWPLEHCPLALVRGATRQQWWLAAVVAGSGGDSSSSDGGSSNGGGCWGWPDSFATSRVAWGAAWGGAGCAWRAGRPRGAAGRRLDLAKTRPLAGKNPRLFFSRPKSQKGPEGPRSALGGGDNPLGP